MDDIIRSSGDDLLNGVCNNSARNFTSDNREGHSRGPSLEHCLFYCDGEYGPPFVRGFRGHDKSNSNPPSPILERIHPKTSPPLRAFQMNLTSKSVNERNSVQPSMYEVGEINAFGSLNKLSSISGKKLIDLVNSDEEPDDGDWVVSGAIINARKRPIGFVLDENGSQYKAQQHGKQTSLMSHFAYGNKEF